MSNVNLVRDKKVTIMLDKERHLKYDLNAYAELEDVYGDIGAAMEALEKGSIKAIRAILWAGLVYEDASLTPQDIGGMIDIKDLDNVTKSLEKALSQSVPITEDTTPNIVATVSGN